MIGLESFVPPACQKLVSPRRLVGRAREPPRRPVGPAREVIMGRIEVPSWGRSAQGRLACSGQWHSAQDGIMTAFVPFPEQCMLLFCPVSAAALLRRRAPIRSPDPDPAPSAIPKWRVWWCSWWLWVMASANGVESGCSWGGEELQHVVAGGQQRSRPARPVSDQWSTTRPRWWPIASRCRSTFAKVCRWRPCGVGRRCGCGRVRCSCPPGPC